MNGELQPGDRIHCRGCGEPQGIWPDIPVPDHCSYCPPWECDGCGQPCSIADPCACWIPLEGMAPADIKAIFAASDLSIGGLSEGTSQ